MSIFILQYFYIHVIYCFDLIIHNLRPQKRAKGGDKNDKLKKYNEFIAMTGLSVDEFNALLVHFGKGVH
jgi:hypothetical protein